MILANPTSEHINYAIKGASNKINIYIEKPLSNSLKKLNFFRKNSKIKLKL